MRRTQKLYFETRTRSALADAKRCEDAVDRALEEFGFEQNRIEQLKIENFWRRDKTDNDA